MKKTESKSQRSAPLDLNWPEGPDWQVLTRTWEPEPGHTYRLARSLQEEGEGPSYEPFPADLTRIPVPDRVLDVLDELTGCEGRLCLLMIRASYSWVEDLGEFRASSRWFTARQIGEEAGGIGMSKESLRQAADTLAERGWIEQRMSEGEATAYRWSLSVPQDRYTPIPAPLLHAHQGISHSALTLLLSVFRATWGWTKKEDGTLKYRRAAELSTSDLEAMTGLSRPTLRSAAEELEAKSALHVGRRHRGAPYEFDVDLSFFRGRLQNSYTPPNCVENSHNTRAQTEQSDPKSAPPKGGSGGRGNAYRVTEEWEEQAIRLLCAEPIEMAPGAARDLVIRRAKAVVEGAIKAFRQRKSDIGNPAGWMYSAIENLWFGSSIPNKSPDVRQSGGEAPIARAFESLTEKREGWEWDEGDEESGSEGLETEPTVGVTHPEMCDLIEDLRRPDGDWETVDRPGKNPVFIPSKKLANWAYFRRDQGSQQFQEAAREVVNLRARHEGRKSPIGGG